MTPRHFCDQNGGVLSGADDLDALTQAGADEVIQLQLHSLQDDVDVAVDAELSLELASRSNL